MLLPTIFSRHRAFPSTYTFPTTGWNAIPSTYAANEQAWNSVDFDAVVGKKPAVRTTVSNSTGAPQTINFNLDNVYNQIGTNNVIYVPRAIYLNNALVFSTPGAPGTATPPPANPSYAVSITIPNGTNELVFFDTAFTTTQYQYELTITNPSNVTGVTTVSTAYSNISAWTYQLI